MPKSAMTFTSCYEQARCIYKGRKYPLGFFFPCHVEKKTEFQAPKILHESYFQESSAPVFFTSIWGGRKKLSEHFSSKKYGVAHPLQSVSPLYFPAFQSAASQKEKTFTHGHFCCLADLLCYQKVGHFSKMGPAMHPFTRPCSKGKCSTEDIFRLPLFLTLHGVWY